MRSHFESMCLIMLLSLPVLFIAPPAVANEVLFADGSGIIRAETDETDNTMDDVDSAEVVKPVIERHTLVEGHAGYRFLSVDAEGGRAAEYDYLHSGPNLGLRFNRLRPDLKHSVEGAYLNDKDYYGDLLFDYSGNYRLHLRTESLFHNLDKELLGNPVFFPGASYSSVQQDAGTRYGVRTEQDTASFRAKLFDYPIHLNLGYWRMLKEGNRQLRFADQSFDGASNFIYAVSRPVASTTHEGRLGFDSHLGPVDLVYDFQVRQFGDSTAIPTANYLSRSTRSGGIQQHNEETESRYLSHTVKMHTSLSGGIVGAASYSYGRRENLSRLTDIKGADQSVSNLQNVAGDLSYTPCREFTLALKYRRQEIDNQNVASLSSSFALPAATPLTVRPSLDTIRDVVTATFSFRPFSLTSIYGEYQSEFLHRDDVNNPVATLRWKLPEDSQTQKGTISVLSRPLKGLRLKAQYSYATTDNPSYGTSFEERHLGQILATYNSQKRWGLSLNYRVTNESNNQISQSVLSVPAFTPLETYQLPRNRTASHSSAGFWVSPLKDLTVNGGLGLLRSSTDQSVLFALLQSGSQAMSNYTSQAQIYYINTSYQLNEKFDVSLGLQQIRSFAEFDPEQKTVSAVSDTSGIKDLSRIKTIESAVSFGLAYHVGKNLSCAMDYAFRDYDNKVSSLFAGSVHSVNARLMTTW